MKLFIGTKVVNCSAARFNINLAVKRIVNASCGVLQGEAAVCFKITFSSRGSGWIFRDFTCFDNSNKFPADLRIHVSGAVRSWSTDTQHT